MKWANNSTARALSHFSPVPTLCGPVDRNPLGSSVMGFSRQEPWSGLPFPPPGDLHDPGIALGSLMSPVLAGRSLIISFAACELCDLKQVAQPCLTCKTNCHTSCRVIFKITFGDSPECPALSAFVKCQSPLTSCFWRVSLLPRGRWQLRTDAWC